MDKEALKESIELFVFDFGYVPLDVRIALNHESYAIHFSIFKKANVTIADCSRVTLAVKEFLINLLGSDDFSLDVSSPGAERILKSPLDYTLFEGKKVKILLKNGSEIKGILKGYKSDSNLITFLDVNDSCDKDVLLSDVSKCQLTLE
jgi:ribosome maturation factor RimP